eukprot:21111-Heterococcus_DN1.PRE.1
MEASQCKTLAGVTQQYCELLSYQAHAETVTQRCARLHAVHYTSSSSDTPLFVARTQPESCARCSRCSMSCSSSSESSSSSEHSMRERVSATVTNTAQIEQQASVLQSHNAAGAAYNLGPVLVCAFVLMTA